MHRWFCRFLFLLLLSENNPNITPILVDGRMLSLDELWQEISLHQHPSLQLDPSSTISPAEHPHLPCKLGFQLHPCRTSELMAELCSREPAAVVHDEKELPTNFNYTRAWLTLMGPVVGAPLPLAMF